MLLTQEIKDSFSAKKKTGAVFVDLTAAYGMAPRPHLQATPPSSRQAYGSLIMELVRNRNGTLITRPGKQSRLQRLNPLRGIRI